MEVISKVIIMRGVMPGFDPASHSHITKRDCGSMPVLTTDF